MPTYEYACQSCGRHFEVVQRFSEDPLRVCEVCGGELRRVFHPVGIVLKGSGFYSTDNRGSRPKVGSDPKKEKEKTKASESSGSSSSDSSASSTSTSAPAKKEGGSKEK